MTSGLNSVYYFRDELGNTHWADIIAAMVSQH